MKQIKEKYVEQYKLYHQNGWGDGVSYPAQHKHIVDLIADTQSKSVLDYGCGKAQQYKKLGLHNDWGFMPSLYDPSIPEFSKLPEQNFDGIYSTDVMEHIPESVIPEDLQSQFYQMVRTHIAQSNRLNGGPIKSTNTIKIKFTHT